MANLSEGSNSKYGSYLRYKKISNYENESKIYNRIRYFIKNYDVDDKLIINQLCDEYNITEKDAKKH